jgi:hypothetical protein
MITQIQRQLSVAIENEPGRLGQIGRLLATNSIYIEAFSVVNNVEQGMVRLVTNDAVATRAILKAAGLPTIEAEVLVVVVSNGLGNLASIGEVLASAGINIEYAYGSAAELGQPTRVVLRTTSPKKALEVLQAI